mgnify:FL=1
MNTPENMGGPERHPQESETSMEFAHDAQAEESRAIMEALQAHVDSEHRRIYGEGEVTRVERGTMLARLAEFLTSTAGKNASKN